MPLGSGQLRSFVAVAEEGQMTRAARRLQIAQPALSQAIARLESELGVALLERHARGVTLTPAGEVFLPKARAALEADADAARMARSLARGAVGTLQIGYVGPPPEINAPELFGTFALRHPDVTPVYTDLPFPTGTSHDWLGDVDVAFCHPPLAEPGVQIETVRVEPRAVMLPRSHPLASRETVTSAEVLDEVFLAYHEDVQPAWAGFHCLDDQRGGPGRRTEEAARTPAEMLRMVATLRASRHAVAAVPLADAIIGQHLLRGIVAVPVSDAPPATLALVWREAAANPRLDALLEVARSVADGTIPRDPDATLDAAVSWAGHRDQDDRR
jgi:DNA-binding transcriptional LysR family regulator